MTKILINTPYIYLKEGGGGVANYYKIFSDFKTSNIDLFFIGKRTSRQSLWKLAINFFQFINDLFRFIRVIEKYDILVVNPSMSKVCILRDSLYIKLALLHKKKTVIFWRGFNQDALNRIVGTWYESVLRKSFFKANLTIVLGRKIQGELSRIGCKTPFWLETTIVPSYLIREDQKVFFDNKFTILFLARLERSKGIFEAIEAYKKIKYKYPFVDMIIAGDGRAFDEINRMIIDQEIDGIKLLGFIQSEQKRKVYNDADMYLLPSYFEGMPNTVLEAMGMGLPIVTTKVGGIPDFFEDGRMGFMINSLGIDILYQAISKLINNKDLVMMSAYNVEYASKNFKDTIVTERLIKKLNSL